MIKRKQLSAAERTGEREAQLPKEDDVLRRLMATPPDPRKAKPKKKPKKRA